MTQKPEIDFIEGPAPTTLVITDLIVGDGPEAVPGGRVEVHYLGVEFDSGEQFDLTKLYRLNYADFSLAMSVLKEWRLDSFRYEPGAVSRAAADPAVAVDAIVLEYGRREEPSAV